MVITDVRLVPLVRHLNRPLCTSKGLMNDRYFNLILVETDSEITGLGEAPGDPLLMEAIVTRRLKPAVLGRNPKDPKALWDHMFASGVFWEIGGSVVCGMSGIEVACWDILGKAEGVPLYELLGGRKRGTIEAYASDLFWDEPELMAESAADFVERGFRFVKCHLGAVGQMDSDLERCAAIRAAIGGDVGFMIDVNTAMDRVSALDLGLRFADFSPFWFEEPLAPLDVEGYVQLRRNLPIPLATGENLYTGHGFEPILKARGCDYIMPDILRCGGVGQTLEVCGLAKQHEVTVSPHVFSGGVGLAVTIHLMAAQPETRLLELDTSGTSLIDEVLESELAISRGMVEIPTGSGLGVVLKEEIVDRYHA